MSGVCRRWEVRRGGDHCGRWKVVPVEGDGREGEAARVISSSADHAHHRMETVPVVSHSHSLQPRPHLPLLGGICSFYRELWLRRWFICYYCKADAKRAAVRGQWSRQECEWHAEQWLLLRPSRSVAFDAERSGKACLRVSVVQKRVCARCLVWLQGFRTGSLQSCVCTLAVSRRACEGTWQWLCAGMHQPAVSMERW